MAKMLEALSAMLRALHGVPDSWERATLPEQPELGYWRIRGKNCEVQLEPRPAYCDRGRFLAHLVVDPGTDPRVLNVDWADGWPRYYFFADAADQEIREWLRRRKQEVDPSSAFRAE